jgi:hypothetical protein
MPVFSSHFLYQVIHFLPTRRFRRLLISSVRFVGLLYGSFFIRFPRDKPFQPDVYDVRGKEPSQEIQLHTWMDATLREIVDLLKAAIPALNEPCRLMFRIVYPDKFGRMVIRTAG